MPTEIHLFRLDFYCLNNVDIIQTICNDKRYFSICKGISSQHCEDLYQQAMLQVCEPENRDRIEKASAEGYLEVFIVGIINNIWGVKNRISSPLYRISDNVGMWQDFKEVSKQQSDHRSKVIKAVNELSKKARSKEKEERDSAKLLWRVSQSNVYTVKKEEGCHSRVILRRITPIITDIKRKLDE